MPCVGIIDEVVTLKSMENDKAFYLFFMLLMDLALEFFCQQEVLKMLIEAI